MTLTAYFPSVQAFQRMLSFEVSEILSLTLKRFRPLRLATLKQKIAFHG